MTNLDGLQLNYTTIETAKGWLGEKIGLYGGNNASDDDIMGDLAIAEGMVDTYVSAQYIAPLTNANAIRLVQGHVRAFFFEQAFARSGSGEAPDGVQKTLARTIKQLEAIAAGEVWLGGLEPNKVEAVASTSIMISDAEPTRDRSSLAGY